MLLANFRFVTPYISAFIGESTLRSYPYLLETGQILRKTLTLILKRFKVFGLPMCIINTLLQVPKNVGSLRSTLFYYNVARISRANNYEDCIQNPTQEHIRVLKAFRDQSFNTYANQPIISCLIPCEGNSGVGPCPSSSPFIEPFSPFGAS